MNALDGDSVAQAVLAGFASLPKKGKPMGSGFGGFFVVVGVLLC
jgi:hypothetical protein